MKNKRLLVAVMAVVVVIIGFLVGTGTLFQGALTPDTDGDGLSLRRERQLGTDPQDADTDDDRLSDGDEYNVYGTTPTDADTDDGGVSDGDEVAEGTDPLWDFDDYGYGSDN